MQLFNAFRISAGVVVGTALALAQPALAANYPLEITNIKPAGTGGMAASSRIYKAYPGLEYNIRAAVIGGAYPFTFSLSNAPAGMTVDARGTIIWSNPQADATPTITVQDFEGTRVSATWTIRVSTTGFRFVNAAAGSSGTGTLASPWRTMADVYNSGATLDVVYFRAGTYTQAGLPRVSIGSAWERVEWGGTIPTTWIAYPGETPVIDFQNGPMIRIGNSETGGQSRDPYIDGFETTNSRIIGIQTGSAGTYRRLRMHNLTEGGDGTNAAFIMTLTQVPPVVGMVIQDSEFFAVNGVSSTLKIYAQEKVLVEDTVHHDAYMGLELKDDVRRYTVRKNLFYNITSHAVGGNMHETGTNGEICFNTMLQSGSGRLALDVNQDGMAGVTYIYRNTMVGRVQMRSALADNGPFYFSNNIIVNSDSGTPSGSHVSHVNVTVPSRIVLSNNLVGYPADNIVDSSGRLTPSYAQYTDTHGSNSQGIGTGGTVPQAPTNVRIIR